MTNTASNCFLRRLSVVRGFYIKRMIMMMSHYNKTLRNRFLLINKRMISDYSRFISKESALRKPSAIRSLQPLLSIDGMISLGGGMPHSSTFPFESMKVVLKGGQDELEVKDFLGLGLQYSGTAGLPELLEFMKELQLKEHHRKDQLFSVCAFNGSQDALSKAIDMLLESGDSVLVEKYTYSGTLALMKPKGLEFLGVECDGDGMVVEELERMILEHRPRVLYTIPTGSNPTGVTTSVERRRRIYELVCKYDLLLLEDDPYYYLQFPSNGTKRVESYFSMDTEGRVLRFDSFSKILSAGIRLGFATGPPQLIERMLLHSQATTLHPSGVSQVLALAVLRQWGIEGFLKHCEEVSEFYKRRRDSLLKSMDKYLKKGLKAEWTVPEAGMFLWIQLLQCEDTSKLIKERALEKKVILLPGVEFLAMSGESGKSSFVRASYSTATEQQFDEAMKRLSELLE